jgi:hypothetical protein
LFGWLDHISGIEQEMAMVQQLRIYEIFEKNKAAFHARFRDHAARIMRTRYGFQIEIAAWSAFMADTEWSEIKRVTHAEHDLMVGQIEDRLLVPVEYSPAKGSLLQPS